MNLNELEIELASDGFYLIDAGHIIPPGTRLRAQYELPDHWGAQEFIYEENIRASFFHPFRKPSMFLYTGEMPIRVVVQAVDEMQQMKTVERGIFDRLRDFSSRSFISYPDYNHVLWTDDHLPACFGVHFPDGHYHPSFPVGGVTGAVVGTTDGFEDPQPPPLPPEDPDQPEMKADWGGADVTMAPDISGLPDGEPNAY